MATSSSTDDTVVQQVRINSAYGSFKHNASITMLVLAPILIAIPPRKLDLYTLSLAGAFVASANQLNIERTGKGLIAQFGRANRPQMQVQAEEETGGRRLLEEKSTIPDEILRRHTGVKSSIEDKAKEIWMGGEPENWKEKRLREEQEKLNQGEGYGSMIMDQIWEVWNWGEKKGEELKEKDQQVLDEKARLQNIEKKTR